MNSKSKSKNFWINRGYLFWNVKQIEILMGWNFRKRVKVFPGFKLNFSKSGISGTVGIRGASVTVGPKGVYV